MKFSIGALFMYKKIFKHQATLMKYTYKQTVQKIVKDQNECLPFKMESAAAEPMYSVFGQLKTCC